jgi:hypothetical protein
LNAPGKRPDLLDRTDADSVRFPQRAIYRSRFRYAHFRTMHQRRYIGWIGIPIPDKAVAIPISEDSGSECPPRGVLVAEVTHYVSLNPVASKPSAEA